MLTRELIENFIDAIKNDKEPQISKEIFNSMSICFAIEESMQTGKIKKVQYLYENYEEIMGAKPFFGGKKEIDQILKNIERVLKSGKLSLGITQPVLKKNDQACWVKICCFCFIWR